MNSHSQEPGAYVIVKLFAWLRDLFGWTEQDVSLYQAPDMRRLLEHLSESAPPEGRLLKKDGAVAEGFIVLLNGLNIDFAGGMEATLCGGDEVAIFPPISGG